MMGRVRAGLWVAAFILGPCAVAAVAVVAMIAAHRWAN